MAKKERSIGKLLGPVGKVLRVLPDSTELINKTIEETAPIISKELDSRRENKKLYRDVPEVVELDITRAKDILEDLGFITQEVLAKPMKKYQNKTAGEVVAISPKGKKAKIGSLIKLYYVDEQVISESRQRELPDVIGMNVEEAKEFLLNEGLKPVLKLATPHKKYAHTHENIVVDSDPKLDLFHKYVKTGSLIYLYYVNDYVFKQSKQLLEEKTVKETKPKKTLFFKHKK